MEGRQLVLDTLEFRNPPRAPRQLWLLPWAQMHHGEAVRGIEADFPGDFGGVNGVERELPATQGDAYELGLYVDPWGARFENRQRGLIGEVKEPIIRGEDWEDWANAHIPLELLHIDRDEVNRQCAATDRFVIAGENPRPFEQLQFLRGTEAMMMDLAYKPSGFFAFLEKMHDFYCRWVEVWAQTDVDAIAFMDDWGSQRSLLIHPKTWVEIFKPLYRDYIDIAKRYGKKTFMHSDGYTLDIIPHMIDIGLDAINAQIFCIGLEQLRPYRGKITFWGEMDRQHLLCTGTPAEVRAAARQVKEILWADGGCIAQCEFGAGARPENVRAVYEGWDEAFR